MEGEGEASNARRPMEGKKETSNARRLMEGEGEAFFSPFSTPPLSNLLRPSSFSFDLTVLLYHSFRSLFTHSLFLSLAYKLQCAFRYHKSSHVHCQFSLVEDPFSFAWNYGVMHGHVLRASSWANEWRDSPIIIFRFDVNATSSWSLVEKPGFTTGVYD
jgi:hypothetical protein